MLAPLSLTSSTPPTPLLDEAGFWRQIRRATLWPAVILTTLAAVLFALVLFLFRAAEWTNHSHRVIAQATVVERLADDTRIASYTQRSDNDIDRPAIAALGSQAGQEMAALGEMVADNPAQGMTMAGARSRFEAWLKQIPASDQGTAERAAFSAFQASMAKLVAEEERLLASRTDHVRTLRTITLVVLGFAVVIGVPLLVITLRRVVGRVGDSYHKLLGATAAQRDELYTSLRSIGDAVLVTDSGGNIAFLNPVAESLTGWTDQEAQGRPLLEVLPIFNEQTGAPAVNPVERVLREKIVVGLANHTVLRSRTGLNIPIEDSAAPIFDTGGAIRGVILVFRDVGEKYARERALRDSEWISRTALEVAGAGAWNWDVQRDLVFGDETMARTFGVPYERCRTGEPIATFIASIHPEDRAKVETQIRQSLAESNVYALEYRVVGDRGVERWVDSRGRVERNGEGVPTRLPGILIDITNQKLAEQERDRLSLENEQQRRLYEAILGSTPDFVYVFDLSHRFTFANSSLLSAWGKTAAEAVGRNCLELGYEKWHAEMHDREIEQVVATRRPIHGEVPFSAAGTGGRRIYDYIFVPVFNAAGEVVSVAGTTRDVTARKQAEEEVNAAREGAEAANRAKDDFLAALSHELRTPLTPVLMTAAALKEDGRLTEDVRRELAMIERNVLLEAKLIDDLLDLTRIAKGKLLLRESECDVHSLIGLAVEIIRDDAQSKPIELAMDLEARRFVFNGDPARLQQVFWNLLRNAIKFTPQGGRVTVHTFNDDTDGRLCIKVSDTGIGMDTEDLERIFRPFEQGGQHRSHQFGGLGLGLAIARAIVDLHGGVIRAESAGQGRGATFTVELPNVKEGAPRVDGAQLGDLSPVTAAPESSAANAAVHILLLEDHEPTLVVLARLLTRAGYQVVTANSVANATAAAESQKFDILVSDLGLPDGTGPEAIAKLRGIQPNLRGIALSGYGMEDDIRRSLDAGFAAHLVKPVDVEQLRRVLREVAATLPVD